MGIIILAILCVNREARYFGMKRNLKINQHEENGVTVHQRCVTFFQLCCSVGC